MSKSLAIVIPVYKSASCLKALYEQILLYISDLQFRLIFVNDGSPDDSLDILKSMAAADSRIMVVNLSRNFGQHIALTAGLAQVTEDRAIVMDCDLQHHPKYISELLKELDSGNDIVLTIQNSRQFGFLRNFLARVFSVVLKFFGADQDQYEMSVGNYSCLSKKAVDAFLKFQEIHRHYLFIVKGLGFKQSYINIEHFERHSGKSSYSTIKLIRHAVDGLVVCSSRLLYISAGFGFFCIIACFFLVLVFLYMYFTESLLPGWLSTVILMTFFSGVNMLCMGILGLYVGKMYEQSKNRPLYIIDFIINKEN